MKRATWTVLATVMWVGASLAQEADGPTIKVRVPATRPSAGSRERRIDGKKRDAKVKRARAAPRGDD